MFTTRTWAACCQAAAGSGAPESLTTMMADAKKDVAVKCDGPCPPEQLATGLVQATALAVDNTNIYFAIESGNGTVFQCPKTGCVGAPMTLGSGYAVEMFGHRHWNTLRAQPDNISASIMRLTMTIRIASTTSKSKR